MGGVSTYRALNPAPLTREGRMQERLASLKERLTGVNASVGDVIYEERLRGTGTAGGTTTITEIPTTSLLMYRNVAKTLPLQLVYTPPVDAWVEVVASIGNVIKLQNDYAYLYTGVSCSPADEDGVAGSYEILTMYGNVITIGPLTNSGRYLRRLLKCAAGVTYTFNQFLGPMSPTSGVSAPGGYQFSYMIASDQLELSIRAYVR